MAEQLRRSSRREKIEPLNYAEAALAPALKGMTSFLDLSPEEVRSGNFIGINTSSLTAPIAEDMTSPAPTIKVPMPSVQRGAGGAIAPPGDETIPAIETSSHKSNLTVFTQLRERTPRSGASRIPSSALSDRTPVPVAASASPLVVSPGGETNPGGTPLEHVTLAISPLDSDMVSRDVSTAAPLSPPAHVSSPGGERDAGNISYEQRGPEMLIPGRGRSKVRRCVLAQDAHSLGEEAIYQVLWRTGKPESTDPNGSRTVRLGSAEIGFKVNMSKKNVRQNIARLFEKLAIQIIQNFETSISQARTYRVFSYKQILERRRAAGLEYVLRNKGVVFCNPDGVEVVLSPIDVSSPGGETSIRPAPSKKRRRALPSSGRSNIAPYPPPASSSAPETSNDADLLVVSEALNRYWTVDSAAAAQLLRSCRRIRQDARAEEIAFFVQEKLELARQSRNITNPTGLILSMVPQSFVGTAFEQFRERMERQALFAAEENERKNQERNALLEWVATEREKCESIINDLSKSDEERYAAEKRLRQFRQYNP